MIRGRFLGLKNTGTRWTLKSGLWDMSKSAETLANNLMLLATRIRVCMLKDKYKIETLPITSDFLREKRLIQDRGELVSITALKPKIFCFRLGLEFRLPQPVKSAQIICGL